MRQLRVRQLDDTQGAHTEMLKAMIPVRACDHIQRVGLHVVHSVIGHLRRWRSLPLLEFSRERSDRDNDREGRDEEGEELHVAYVSGCGCLMLSKRDDRHVL